MVKLDKFYRTYEFSTMTINFSEVWPRQILDLGKQFNLMIGLKNVLKISLQDVFKTSWRRLEDALKTSMQDVLKTSRRRRAKTNILVLVKTSWRRLLKTYGLGEYICLDQDVFWRRRRKTSSPIRMFDGIC